MYVLHTMVVCIVREHSTKYPHSTRQPLPVVSTLVNMECAWLLVIRAILASVILATQVRTGIGIYRDSQVFTIYRQEL